MSELTRGDATRRPEKLGLLVDSLLALLALLTGESI